MCLDLLSVLVEKGLALDHIYDNCVPLLYDCSCTTLPKNVVLPNSEWWKELCEVCPALNYMETLVILGLKFPAYCSL